MLIFDDFPTRELAEDFAKTVTSRYNRAATVYDSQEASNAVDPFPFTLNAPIVLVERIEIGDDEREIEKMVLAWHGLFAGT
jgi:hypothetical protein